MKGFAAYSPCGATSETCAVGESMETITNTAKNAKKVGFSSLPTHVKIFPGRSENQSAAAKNTKEKINSHVPALLSGRRCSKPTVKEVVAQRGLAKNGPIVKYSRQVKNMP